MEEFETIDIDNNNCRFQYEIVNGDELNPDRVYFKVFSIPQDEMRWFSYTFRIINDNTAKGEMMTNNNCAEFAKKGIPEKVIELVSEFLRRRIISSPITPGEGDYLVGPSYRVWERLVENNANATFNEAENCFELDYPLGV